MRTVDLILLEPVDGTLLLSACTSNVPLTMLSSNLRLATPLVLGGRVRPIGMFFASLWLAEHGPTLKLTDVASVLWGPILEWDDNDQPAIIGWELAVTRADNPVRIERHWFHQMDRIKDKGTVEFDERLVPAFNPSTFPEGVTPQLLPAYTLAATWAHLGMGRMEITYVP